MALFDNLHHVGEVLTHVIGNGLSFTPSGNVSVGPPLETVNSTTEDVRVTLLWTTQQPTHRNDPWQRTPSGTTVPPPLSLSAYFLVTTYGSATLPPDDPQIAHRLLGEVMEIFHTTPVFALPLSGLAGVGEGELSVVQVPSAADLMEKVFSPFQMKPRPWVLYEVGPVQLRMRRPARAPAPLVAPGGVNLGDAVVAARPRVLRVTPDRQALGGHVRLDVDVSGRPVEALQVGGLTIGAAAVTALSESIVVTTLPPSGLAESAHDVRVRVGTNLSPPVQFSDAASVVVLPPDAPALDAPSVAFHSAGSDLTLTGRNLAGAVAVLAWPDAGIASPSEVRSLPLSAASNTEVTVASAALAPSFTDRRIYRVAVRLGGQQYTPYALLEIGP